MSMTPGPWWVSELNASENVSEYYIFIEPGIAVIERAIKGQDQHDMPNARAIAALPDLVEALKSVIDGWDNWSEKGRMEAAIDAARAALNKAGVTQ